MQTTQNATSAQIASQVAAVRAHLGSLTADCGLTTACGLTLTKEEREAPPVGAKICPECWAIQTPNVSA